MELTIQESKSQLSTISYKDKLTKLLADKPDDNFYQSCMTNVDQLSDRQKAWINSFYYNDSELVDLWLKSSEMILDLYRCVVK